MLGLWTLPAAAAYRVEVAAPAPLRALLSEFLDLARYKDRTDISPEQLQFLIDTAPAQVQKLSSTEGYFSPTTHVVADGEGDARVVRVHVEPGPRTRVTA
ncbi:MAG: outer membrane protein assembly factor, partial [Burkholderiaceae bacterium]